MRNPFNYLAPKISNWIQRTIRALKCRFSQLFACKLEEVEKEKEMEMEMEIGFPTDVKHLTHIGCDGSSSTTNAVKGWENLRGPELVASPSISFKQFELAMAAQAADQQQLHQIAS
ncbi:unnamed protein product [Rhodiola kirilowii]